MFHKKTLLTLAVLGLILTAGIASTFAFGGEQGQKANWSAEDIAAKRAAHEGVMTAVENGDYSTWLELTATRPNAPEVSEQDFASFREAHNLMQAGDYEGAKAIFDELGIDKGFGKKGKFKGMHKMYDKNGDGVCDRLDKTIE
jgi:hypothetical protein